MNSRVELRIEERTQFADGHRFGDRSADGRVAIEQLLRYAEQFALGGVLI